ncbi:transcriptional regulator GlxA family with amidase domain [Gracilibacillus halotolerans]|uniref:Transcriptional regulator GlxA family with amidase domain n=1 Tax=Gracilibacillus halotolerans TaxID=74386 RepID=A0A841RPH3_9BACI|nr:DJ-1/PfpI family protein [Gracilibacillus halotolerans]MBB6514429.1 transcriptional regulator GlxA family with amidase domain [Gracilibacillus halotolerans]
MKKQWTVGILLFDEVEVLDFAGPFEVFSITTYEDFSTKAFDVSTISETGEIIFARNGLKVQPDYSFENAPAFDIVVVPGGPGVREAQIDNPTVIEWIANQMNEEIITTSICTGAFLLAKAGVLNGKVATTHWMSYDRFEESFPEITLRRNVKFVDQGNILTSGGVSAGINMSLYIVQRLLGENIASNLARGIEFDMKF